MSLPCHDPIDQISLKRDLHSSLQTLLCDIDILSMVYTRRLDALLVFVNGSWLLFSSRATDYIKANSSRVLTHAFSLSHPLWSYLDLICK